MKSLAVVICSHNPRPDYLERVLVALRSQTLEQAEWELVLVDNRSDVPLSDGCTLDWHPAGRVVSEPRLGLTAARLRGIAETNAPLLVFVDDDNVLAPDYLARALEIGARHTLLGAWSGQVIPEFETDPPRQLRPLLHLLCIRELQRDVWGNHTDSARLPFGAGLCLRRAVAARYASDLLACPARMALDRTGELLYSSGDLDLGVTALAMGCGTGLFCQLKLTHLIPSRRLDEPYLLKLARDGAASYVVFNRVWGFNPATAVSSADRMLATYKFWRGSSVQRKLARALREGELMGRRLATSLQLPEAPGLPARNAGTGGYSP